MRISTAFLRLANLTAIVLIMTGCSASALKENMSALSNNSKRDVLFTEQWKFLKGNDIAALDPGFDDSQWRTLDLPHDWSVEGPFDSKWAACTAFLPCGTGWYRKTFNLGDADKNKSISIRFDGVMNHSTVWCNGHMLGERPFGYISFSYDLTPWVKFGAANVIAVRVDHEQFGDSRWYAGSGIYRNVFLSITDKVHVDTNGTFVTTPQVDANSAVIDVKTIVKNDGADAADVTLVSSIKDAGGKTIASLEEAGSIQAGGEKQFAASEKIPAPKLWSPGDAYMYSVQTQVKRNGAVVDQYSTPFGIRTFAFDPDKGFSINGQNMKLKGVCLHHDAGALGGAVPIEVWERRLKLLQEAGCNAIRCSHNPPSPEFLDLCDRMGFIVMDEAFDEWSRGKVKWVVGYTTGKPGNDGYHSDFDQWADADIHDMVVRDRNHPSIVMWSIGNEIDYKNDPYPPNSPELPRIAERLIKDVKAVDTTRPVTAACASPATNLYKKLLDVEGYNYMEALYDKDHAANPKRVIYGSENSHTASAWQAVAKNDYIAGQFLWTGIDYLGEAGVWPAHANESGLLDLAGFRKNQFYFRKALWTDAPMVYLSTSGIPIRRQPATMPAFPAIHCYTNCDSVELFHDGQSLGSKSHADGEIIVWPTEFTSGVMKAVGKKGDATTTFELKHAGPPAKIELLPDISSLQANGRAVAQIEVQITDADGTLVPDAENLLTCALSGPAQIIGIENGNIYGTESNKGPSHSVHQGKMLIYLQSLKTAGELKLTISSPNLEDSSITLPVH